MQVKLDEIILDTAKVPQTMAVEEFQKWLDYKKTKIKLTMSGSDEEKADNKAEIAIIEAIMSGDLVIGEDLSMTYNLAFPIKSESGSVEVSSLTLKPRLTAYEVQKATKGISQDEPFNYSPGTFMCFQVRFADSLINWTPSTSLCFKRWLGIFCNIGNIDPVVVSVCMELKISHSKR